MINAGKHDWDVYGYVIYMRVKTSTLPERFPVREEMMHFCTAHSSPCRKCCCCCSISFYISQTQLTWSRGRPDFDTSALFYLFIFWVADSATFGHQQRLELPAPFLHQFSFIYIKQFHSKCS